MCWCVPEVAVRDLEFLDFLWPQGMELLSPVLGPSGGSVSSFVKETHQSLEIWRLLVCKSQVDSIDSIFRSF